MNIQVIGGAVRPPTMGPMGAGGQRPDETKMLKPVADELGMNLSDLKSALAGGTTLDQLAKDKGVSHTDLVNSIKQGLEAAKPADAPSIGGLDSIAEMIASGGPGSAAQGSGPLSINPDRPRQGVNNADSQALSNVANALQMSTSDLLESLLNGSSLTDLAKGKGVSTDSVLDAVGRGMIVNTTL
jgi:hypothetical protein